MVVELLGRVWHVLVAVVDIVAPIKYGVYVGMLAVLCVVFELLAGKLCCGVAALSKISSAL